MRLVSMHLNANQRYAQDKLKEQVAKGRPIRAIVDKARRMGASAYIDALGVCHCVSEPNANALIVAHLTKTSDALFKVPLTLVKGLPFAIPDPLKESITFRHKAGNSILSIATAKTVVGGRGAGFSFLHLSEAAYFPGTGSYTALINTVSKEMPESMIFVESTANTKVGVGEEFYRMWCASVEGQNDYIPIFLSWLNDPTFRRDAEEATDAPIDDDERELLQIVCCEDKCGRCYDCYRALQNIAWRRWAIPNMCQGYIDVFHQEYPVTWQQSFVSLKDPAFTNEDRLLARKLLRPPHSTGVLISKDGFGGIPEFVSSSDSPLKIWQHPIPELHYYFGVDAARGQDGGDYAAIVGWCGESGEQAFRYANRINPEALAQLCNQLGRYYNNAKISIELTGNLGLWAQTVLRDRYRYPNFYKWKGRDDRLYDGFVPRTVVGWETNSRSRHIMMTAYRSGLKYGRCKVFDEGLLTQMESAEREEGRWVVRIGHDDILVAAMVGWICLEQWHVDSLGSSQRNISPESVDEQANLEQNRAMQTSTPDVQAAHAAHWRKVTRLMKHGKPPERLEGV